MSKKSESEPTDKKRILLFVACVVALIGFTAWLIWSNLESNEDENAPSPAPAPAPAVPDEEEDIPDSPDDIGVEDPDDVDFITDGGTGGDQAGVMSDIPLTKDIEGGQASIYEAAKAAESGIWAYENYGTDTDSEERAELLEVMFAKDTPMPLELPSKEERLEATTGMPMEFIVNIHTVNGIGGTEDDFRVELTGEKQTVITPTNGSLLGEDSYNGMNRIDYQDYKWLVSMKKVNVEETDREAWVVYNFNTHELVR